MKATFLFSVLQMLAVIFVTTAAFADTPAQIIADYRRNAAQAISGVNQTLEKSVVQITANLLKAGDTKGVELITEQLKEKLSGETVKKPLPSVMALFAQ